MGTGREREDGVSEANYWSITRQRVSRRGVLAASGAAALLAACGGSSKTASKASSGQAQAPKTGGQLNVAWPVDPFDFDPTGKPSENTNAIKPAYDSLLTFKAGPDVKTSDEILQPGIAQKWESPDGQTFIFHMQPGVKFANLPPVNGRAVTVADLKFSMEYASRTGSLKGDKKLFPALNTWAFDGMDSLQTPDDSTLSIHFGAPFSPFLYYIAQFWFPILPHEIYDQDGSFSNRIVGTGPWQLDTTSVQRGTRYVYKRNPTYFRQGQPYLDALNWIIVKDDATQIAAFQTKQIDILGADHSPVDATNAPQIAKANPGAIQLTSPATKGGIVYTNVTRPPLNDLRVRKAIALSIDRSEFVKSFGAGNELWSAACETPGFFTQQEMEKMCVFDVQQAKQMLAAAGYANGLDIEVINPGPDRGQKEVGMIQLFQAQLKKAGINIVYHPLDRASEGVRKKTHDFFLDFDGGGSNDDIDSALYANFYSKSDKNYGKTNDPDLDKLILAQRQETDPNKRRDIVRQAVQRTYDQVYGPSFFFAQGYQFAWPVVKNYNVNSYIRGMSATDAWVQR
jgi:ABC-type transport system substrate-binding protein